MQKQLNGSFHFQLKDSGISMQSLGFSGSAKITVQYLESWGFHCLVVPTTFALRPPRSVFHMKMESDSTSDDIKDSLAWLVTSGALPGVGGNSICDGKQTMRLRGPNKLYLLLDARKTFERFYFATYSVYSKQNFKRRVRVPRVVFDRLCEEIIGREIFVNHYDAFTKPSIDSRFDS